MKKLILTFIFFLFFVFSFSLSVDAKSGCCSWHGGVDYCDTSEGRYVCNDGTYSPSCGCAYIPPEPTKNYYSPTATPTPHWEIITETPTPKPIVETTTNDSNSSDNGLLSGLRLIILIAGGYWIYKWFKK